ncbi:DUF1569 domain-containing protein [Hyunsoonleella rubra]|uniref:DUF1569 domain-containing protein n=1 Tax=Hyunsoonleella rubra TaxID=1737062 RepID=A0ABW5T749_9FLAO
MECKKTERVHQLLQEIEEHIPFKDKKNTAVSQATVGWQLDHALKVVNGITGILARTNEKPFKKDFNLTRLVLFGLNFIPRGRAKAPKIVLPPESISKSELLAQVEKAKTQLENTKTLKETAHFKHHIFGVLSKKQAMRFLELHTNHHLKIVREILK